MSVPTDSGRANSKFCSQEKERAGPGFVSCDPQLFPPFPSARVLWLQKGFLLSLFSLTRESQKMFHLSLAARNGLPAPSAHEIESEGPAAVPDPQKHPHGHLQGEGGPGGAGAVPPRPGLAGGHGHGQPPLLTVTDLRLFYPSLLHLCIHGKCRRSCQQKGKHRKWNPLTGTVIYVFYAIALIYFI